MVTGVADVRVSAQRPDQPLPLDRAQVPYRLAAGEGGLLLPIGRGKDGDDLLAAEDGRLLVLDLADFEDRFSPS